MMSSGDFALSDLRVVEVAESSESISICGRMLAELGADTRVYKLASGEHLKGDDSLNPKKVGGGYGIPLDLTDPAQVKKFRSLLSEADVLLVDRESDRAIELLGLNEGNVSLIFCCISPFGRTGRSADMPASELTVQALAGVLAANGAPEDEPMSAGVPIAAFGSALYATMAILAALYERWQTGGGQQIDVSEFDTLFSFQGTLIAGLLLNGEQFQRVGNRHAMSAPWNTYPALDGWIVIATVGDRQWQSLAMAMGRTDLAADKRFTSNPDRVKNVSELDRHICHWTKGLRSAEIVSVLEKAEVPASPVLSVAEAWKSPEAIPAISSGAKRVSSLPFKMQRSRSRHHLQPAASTQQWEKARFPVGAGAESANRPALGGVRVIEVGILTAGPLVGKLLGMLGAEVIKIEPPEGERTRRISYQIDGTSFLYHVNNTDKFGITIDARSPEQRSKAQQLCATADVLVSNVSEAALRTIGLAPGEFERQESAPIFCSVTGYGRDSSRKNQKTFDMVVQAQTGIMALTGFCDGHPTKIAVSIVDLMSALSATVGVLVALIAKRRYGYSQTVDASLYRTGLWMTREHFPEVSDGHAPSRIGNRSRRYAPQGCFQTKDGMIAMTIQNDDQWRSFLRIADGFDLHRAEGFLPQQERVDRADEVERFVSIWLRARTTSEAIKLLNSIDVPVASCNTLSEVLQHPLVSERRLLVAARTKEGTPIKVFGAPIKMSRSSMGVFKRAPQIGEHNAVLHEMLMRRAPY